MATGPPSPRSSTSFSESVGDLSGVHHLRSWIEKTNFVVLLAPLSQVKLPDFFATHPVFTRSEFGEVRNQASARTGTNLLAYYVRTGRLLRVRRGLYAVVPRGVDVATFSPDPYLVATRLAPDAVVAYHAALQYRGRTYSIWNRFHVVTRTKVTAFTFRGSTFLPVRPPTRTGGGTDGIVEKSHAGGTVRVTTFERTLVDLVDAPDVGGGWEEVWRSLEMVDYFHLDAVVREALARDTAITAARVGFFLEQHRDVLQVEERYLALLRARRLKQPAYLDARRTPGRLVASWNLVVPDIVLERRWAEVA